MPAPGVFLRKPAASAASTKEHKWGQYRDGVVQRLAVLLVDCWTMVYTDGWAKRVRGWWQAGYGAWFGDADERNTGLPILVTERQSVSRNCVSVNSGSLPCAPRCGDPLYHMLESPTFPSTVLSTV